MSDVLSHIKAYLSAHWGWFVSAGGVISAIWAAWEKIVSTWERLANVRRSWHEGTEVKIRIKKAKEELRRMRRGPDVQPGSTKNIILAPPLSFRLLLLPFTDRAALPHDGEMKIKARIKYQKCGDPVSTEHDGVWVDSPSQETCAGVGSDGSGLILAVYSRNPPWVPYPVTTDLPSGPLLENLFGSQSGTSHVGLLVLGEGSCWMVTTTINVDGFRRKFHYRLVFNSDGEPTITPIGWLELLKMRLLRKL